MDDHNTHDGTWADCPYRYETVKFFLRITKPLVLKPWRKRLQAKPMSILKQELWMKRFPKIWVLIRIIHRRMLLRMKSLPVAWLHILLPVRYMFSTETKMLCSASSHVLPEFTAGFSSTISRQISRKMLRSLHRFICSRQSVTCRMRIP